PYWINLKNGGTIDEWVIYATACAATNTQVVAGCASSAPVTITTTGSGTITMTPLVETRAKHGWMGLDTKGQRIWVSSGGTVATAPATLIGHDFTYLTQKTKAVPPYITAHAGRMIAVSGTGLPR